MSTPTASQLLRDSGLRVTPARRTVLDILVATPHADAAEVLRQVREQGHEVSVQGVYDVLTALAEGGLLRRIQPAHSPARFELEHGDNHHHAVCRSCQRLVDVPCAERSAPCMVPTSPPTKGFVIDEAEVIYWGFCADCQDSRPTT